MEQRRLRLGDILDDYCPRERRVTNHAIVAMIEDDVKQTRCTTCDTEHAYKGGHAPRRRKPESTGALYKEVLAGVAEPGHPSPPSVADTPDMPDETSAHDETLIAADEPAEPEHTAVGDEQPEADNVEPPDEGPVHRPLIRAQLPRPEGMKIERTAPEFTIRQNAGRGGGFRRDGGTRGGGQGRNNGQQRFGQGQARNGGRGRGNDRFGSRKRSR